MQDPLYVLILENDEIDVYVMIDSLISHGFSVKHLAVDNREDFIRAVTAGGPDGDFDVILADYSLPGYDALAALQDLQAHGVAVPFIIVTGVLDDRSAVESIRLGAKDYLLKDRLHRLGPAVERALGEVREARARREIERALNDEKEKTAQALRLANVDLEQRIAERTHELREANALLREEIVRRENLQQALVDVQKMRALGDLAAGVAHHFNNLLTAVIGNIEMALAKSRDPAVNERLGLALRASHTGASLTRQLLSFSRQQVIHPEVIDTSARLRDAGSLAMGVVRDALAIDVDIAADLLPIKVDASELELAILNLMFNARDAMDGAGTIRLSARNMADADRRPGLIGAFVLIEVADDGEGIAPELLSRVFEPFFTTKEIGRGSGLGLSQVHGFVHQAGGALTIDSTPGNGTAVRIFLPASDACAPAPDIAPPAELPGQPRNNSILVVDDEVLVAQLTGSILEQTGFKVEVSYDSAQAQRLLRGGTQYDLLVTDIVMPGMSGIELAEQAKIEFPAMSVLLITGHTDQHAELADKGLPVLVKPFTQAQLTGKVESILRANGSDAAMPAAPEFLG